MILHRLSKCKYVSDLSGEGGRLYGGRWHSKGTPVLYMASSKSLALLEVLVHLPITLLPDKFCMAVFDVPDNSIYELKDSDLPSNWKEIQHQKNVQQLGDAFVRKADYLMLKVPSVIIHGEYNYLINTSHPKISKVKLIETDIFTFDERLI